MTDENSGDPGEIVTPSEHAFIVSPDRLNVGLVFDDYSRERLTILLPLLAASDLWRQLGEILGTLGVEAGGTRHTTGKPN
jgi:hypothetical protein